MKDWNIIGGIDVRGGTSDFMAEGAEREKDDRTIINGTQL
jgi:hypothetical protein